MARPTANAILADKSRHFTFPVGESYPPRQTLRPLEISLLLSAPDRRTRRGLRDAAVLELLYGAGLRASEVASLRVDSIRWADRSLFVRGKGGNERLAPLAGMAAETLALYLGRGRCGDWVFPGRNGRPLGRSAVWGIVKRAARAAGLPEWIAPHALRHSFATHLHEGGASIEQVRRFLGHAHLATTAIYTHVELSMLRKTMRTCHPREHRGALLRLWETQHRGMREAGEEGRRRHREHSWWIAHRRRWREARPINAEPGELAKVNVECMDREGKRLRCLICDTEWIAGPGPNGRRAYRFWTCPQGCNEEGIMATRRRVPQVVRTEMSHYFGALWRVPVERREEWTAAHPAPDTTAAARESTHRRRSEEVDTRRVLRGCVRSMERHAARRETFTAERLRAAGIA